MTLGDRYNQLAGLLLPFAAAAMLWLSAGPLSPYEPPGPGPGPGPGPAPTPHPSPSSVVAIGHNYAVHGLAHTYADALDAAGSQVAAGIKMGDVVSGFQKTWQAAREAEFTKSVAPTLSAAIPEGTEGDSAGRASWAAAATGLAKGMREVK